MTELPVGAKKGLFVLEGEMAAAEHLPPVHSVRTGRSA